jgi:sigma-E factor negative regulatory protein RseA
VNEQLDSQLSAMFDDELPAAECELLARRLSRDEAVRARWERYALIGAAMRAERGVRPVLAQRVAQALGNEAPLAAPASPSPVRARLRTWRTAAAGAALAAGLAAATLLWLHAGASRPASPPLAANLISPPQPVAAHALAAAGGYIVPASGSRPAARRIVVPGTQLANYLVAHFEVSSPVAGQAMLSALVAGEGGTGAAGPGSDERVPEDVKDDATTTVE